MNNENNDHPSERDIILARIKEDELLKALRDEVDQFRQLQSRSEQQYFEEVAAGHPELEKFPVNAKELREIENEAIAKRRLGFDHHVREQRDNYDKERGFQDSQYGVRIQFWKDIYEEPLPPIDKEDRAYLFDQGFHNTGPERTDDFRNPDFVFGHEIEPDGFVNQMRENSFDFWKSMDRKYPSELVESELKTNLIHPVLDFTPWGIGPERDDLADAEIYHANLDWRVNGDRYDDERWQAEYKLAHEPQFFTIGGARIIPERDLPGIKGEFLENLVTENDRIINQYPASEQSQISTPLNQLVDQFTNQVTEDHEFLPHLSDDGVREIFDMERHEVFERYRKDQELER